MKEQSRVARLERELAKAQRELRQQRRWLMGFSVVALCSVAGACLSAHATRKVFINAESFNVMDGAGTIHATLGVGESGAGLLTFFDQDGQPSLQLGISGGVPTVMARSYQVVDEKSRVRATLGGGEHPASHMLTFYDDAGHQRLELGTQDGVLPAVVGLVDEKGGLRASLALNPENQAALTFRDDAGAVRMAAGVVNGQPRLAATGEDGSLRNWPE